MIPVIYRPWWCPLKTELILKVLESCPDLLRNAVRHFASVANPLRTGQKFFVITTKFLIKVIEACHPSFLKKNDLLDNLTLTDFTYWIKDVCLPVEILIHIKGGKLLQHRNFEFRLVTNQLLLTMFNQYTKYMAIINRREHNRAGGNVAKEEASANSLRKFKFDILNHLLTNFPTIEDILASLSMSIETKHVEGVDVLAHLNVAFDLVLTICQENRSFVNKTSVILDYLELLRPFYTTSEDSFSDDNIVDQMTNIKLEMKAIKTILLLFPKVLQPQKERFQSVLTSFIKAFAFGNRKISAEAGLLLRSIFKNTGIFDSGELEIDIWLELVRFMNANTLNIITQVFNEVFKVSNKIAHFCNNVLTII